MRTQVLLDFIIKNFIPPIAFFVAFHEAGAKAAISIAVGLTAAQVLFFRIRGLQLSPIFLVASGFTVLFGSIDLLLVSPMFFKIEPFLQNALIGTVLAASQLSSFSLLEWFARGIPSQIHPQLGKGEVAYLRKLTWIWSGYFYLKAILFLYLAFQVDLGKLILLRSVIGSASFVLLLAGEVLYRTKIRPRRRGEKSGPTDVASRPERDEASKAVQAEESEATETPGLSLKQGAHRPRHSSRTSTNPPV